MKAIIRVYKWILLSVILQVLVLFFINNIYLNRGGEIKVTSLDTDGKAKKDINVKVPSGVEYVKVSFDTAFAAYIKSGSLEIFDLQKKKVKETITPEGDGINYFRWLSDRNMLIYSESSAGDKSGSVKVTTHDVDSGTKRSYPPITKLSKQCEVVDIQLSALTNIVYVKVKASETSASIYKYNIMDNLTHVMNTGVGTVIKETVYTDKLVYQDSKNKVFVNDGIKGRKWQIPYKNKIALIGIDSEDKVYVGDLNKENKVYNIHYGKVTTNSVKGWNRIDLKEPLSPENIIVSPDDFIFEIRAGENAVIDVQNGKRIEFKGKYMEVIKGYVVSLNGNELRLKLIN